MTVTHAEVTRYFMTIPEASQLVIQAGAMAEGGDLFLLEMGELVRVRSRPIDFKSLRERTIRVARMICSVSTTRRIGITVAVTLHDRVAFGAI